MLHSAANAPANALIVSCANLRANVATQATDGHRWNCNMQKKQRGQEYPSLTESLEELPSFENR